MGQLVKNKRIRKQVEEQQLKPIESDILKALNEKSIFVGYMMFCRYLNGRGYVRYGCNAGYPENDKSGKARIHPCKVLCPNVKYTLGRIKYYVNKLAKRDMIFTEKRLFYDSRNPNSNTIEHKTDLFVIIACSEIVFRKFIGKNTLEGFIEVC